MPMLMTLRIRLPVWPFHSPLRTRLEKPAILSSTSVDLRHHVLAVHHHGLPLGGTQGHMQDGPLFRDVDLLTAKHGIDASPQAGLLGQLQKKPECLVGDAVFRVVKVDPDSLGRHSFPALSIVREELAKMKLPNLRVMGFEGLPCRKLGERAGYLFPCSSLFHRRIVIAHGGASRLPPGSMIKSLLCRLHVGLLASPNLQSRCWIARANENANAQVAAT